MRPLLVLRPQPGADATAARAKALGLDAIVTPLFRIEPCAWDMPDGSFDALLFTSANAARRLDDRLDRSLPVYVVGDATGQAVREAGFTKLIAGQSDIREVIRRVVADGMRSMLHLAGKDRTEFDPAGVRIETRIVYAAVETAPDPAFARALTAGAVVLLHSTRAARRFRELAGTGHRIAAISAGVAAAAGPGWIDTAIATRPIDDALLAAAARLCQ